MDTTFDDWMLKLGFQSKNGFTFAARRMAHQRFVYEALGVYKHFTLGLSLTLFIYSNFGLITCCPMIYTLCCAVVLCFRLSVSVGKDILFCNYWLQRGLVRIVNVYGFKRWHFQSVYLILSSFFPHTKPRLL
jgi:hypothetical protein